MHNPGGRTRLALPVVSVIVFLVLSTRIALGYRGKGQPGGFELTGSLTQTIGSPSFQTLLSDGSVLVTDGISADVYEPRLGLFHATGSPTPALQGPTVVPLMNGTVLVVGIGICDPLGINNNSELYDPKTGAFSPTGNMVNPSALATGVRLQNGKVLIIEGWQGCGSYPYQNAELYEPTAGTFSQTGPMTPIPYPYEWGSTATLLVDGRVFVAGGTNDFDCGYGSVGQTDIYNSEIGTFSPGPALNIARQCHTATLLRNGKVLIAGGVNSHGACGVHTGELGYLASAELYDPATNSISLLESSMSAARCGATATLLENGLVLIAGGLGGPYGNTTLSSAELFDPGDNTFRHAGDMVYARSTPSSTLLPDSQVLITGGSTLAPESAELYEKGLGAK